jgi:hypothetical protein
MGFGRDRARQSFEGLSEAHADNAMPSFFRVNWRMTHVTGSAIEAKADFSAPGIYRRTTTMMRVRSRTG